VTSKPSALERLSTGSAAFDRILGGGLPVRSLTVIAGEPGAGKTLFALQVLFHLAKQGKKCLYFTTLSEPSLKLIQYMQQFSFFDEGTIGKQMIFVDLGSVIRGRNAEAAIEAITSRVEQEEPDIVVIDSFKAMRDILGDAPSIRTFVYDLAVHMAGWGAATLFVGEYTDEEMAHYAEFTIADGILRFSTRREALTAVRMVEILKLRGSDCVTGRHFFEIGPEGLIFFPRVRSPDADGRPSIWSLAGRAPTGIAGLDEMLGGGLPRASSTVIQGATGTGKTLLGLQFLLEGARRGEPGIHFTLEETADQLRGIAQGFGWDLRDIEQRGLLTFHYVSPVELSTDAFLNRARELVEQLGARRAVLDSLTSMELGVPSERRFKELVYAMTKHFRAMGVTLSLNMDIADLLGSAQLSGHGISFAADNVIQLKYVELDGNLERGISVLKARGVRHATDVRRMNFTQSGIEVGAPFKGLRGVLTGLPTPMGAGEP
jgi:circadian clock protein KaiC